MPEAMAMRGVASQADRSSATIKPTYTIRRATRGP